MLRDRSIDLAKGFAIWALYVGHSILSYPINIGTGNFLGLLNSIIISFNMPMFFMISGYLFAFTKKSSHELYMGKVMRLLIPYLFTMMIVVAGKQMLPSSMSSNKAVDGGLWSMLYNWLLEGGDRWFVYTLLIIFVLLIPFRRYLSNKWVCAGIMAGSFALSYPNILPKAFTLDLDFYYMIFFVFGYMLKDKYESIKTWSLKHWYIPYAAGVMIYYYCNHILFDLNFSCKFLVPFITTWGIMTMIWQVEKVKENNPIVRFMNWCGKHSLQLYLFSFCFPIIRMVIVSTVPATNYLAIFFSVLILQFLCIAIIVETTKRIKWLKVPMGY